MVDIYSYTRINKLIGHSAIYDVVFRDFFKTINIKTVVEIGTYKGISAAWMAQFANKVITFDIKDYSEKYKLWEIFGLKNKIQFYKINNRIEIAKILKDIDFDFAFIDAAHNGSAVRRDFELVEKCGRVLFHDTHVKTYADINRFVKKIGAKAIGSNFGYWTKEGNSMIDIVITTYNRLSLLKQTLTYIWERTLTPYRLKIIDDSSSDGTVGYLNNLIQEGKLSSVYLHTKRCGIPAHLNSLVKITDSDFIVFSDDDVLCPKLKPDWLEQGLAAMVEHPEIGLLGLNNPHCNVGNKRGRLNKIGKITLCQNIPGHFVFVRREILNKLKINRESSPVKAMCFQVAKLGYQIGYLNEVFCQHIGVISVRNHKNLSKEIIMVQPINSDTLEPPYKYKY